MRGQLLALLCGVVGLGAASAAAQPSGPPPAVAPPSYGAQLIKPPGPQNLERPDSSRQSVAPAGSVFCPGGDMVIANDSPQEARAGAKAFPCSGPLFVLVCHGGAGQYGVFIHEIAPGRHRDVETPAGSSFEAQCDAPPARQCPARYCVGP